MSLPVVIWLGLRDIQRDECFLGADSLRDQEALAGYAGLTLVEAERLASSDEDALRVIGADGACADRTDDSPHRVRCMEAQARSWRLAMAEATQARWKYDSVADWLATSLPASDTPVAADVWVFTPDFQKVLLVRHRWRGWVPPGGKVDPGEHPWHAARRELLEETGLLVQPDPTPAAAAVRQFHADWSHTLALSYAAVVSETACDGEAGQPAEWTDLRSDWATCFGDDQERLVRHAEWLRQRGRPGAGRSA